MKRLFTLLSAIGFLLAASVWVVLLAFPTETIASLGELPSGALYFTSIFALLTGAAVLAFGDRCLQFIGAISCVIAFLGLAAFHSTHTHRRTPVAESVADAD